MAIRFRPGGVSGCSFQTIALGLRPAGDGAVLTIANDGAPLPPEPGRNGGMGLRILRYRAGLIGDSAPGFDPQGLGTAAGLFAYAARWTMSQAGDAPRNG